MIWESIPQCLGPFGVVKHRKGAFQGASPLHLALLLLQDEWWKAYRGYCRGLLWKRLWGLGLRAQGFYKAIIIRIT